MFRLIQLVLAGSVISMGIASQARGATQFDLSPATKWHLDYSEDSCRLLRMFGEGDEQSVLYFERYGPGNRQFVALASPLLKGRTGGSKATFRFGPGEQSFDSKYSLGEFGKWERAVFLTNADIRGEGDTEPVTPEREAAIEWFSIVDFSGRTITFQTGNMEKPFAALRECTSNLMRSWGLDVERHEAGAEPVKPKGNPSNWISPASYPLALSRKGMQGLVQARLMVSDTGEVTSCHIQKSTRPKEFDDAVCETLSRRARFEPARDAAGSPMPSYWQTAVRFVIPN